MKELNVLNATLAYFIAEDEIYSGFVGIYKQYRRKRLSCSGHPKTIRKPQMSL
jgi:hypothetical protein